MMGNKFYVCVGIWILGVALMSSLAIHQIMTTDWSSMARGAGKLVGEFKKGIEENDQ